MDPVVPYCFSCAAIVIVDQAWSRKDVASSVPYIIAFVRRGQHRVRTRPTQHTRCPLKSSFPDAVSRLLYASPIKTSTFSYPWNHRLKSSHETTQLKLTMIVINASYICMYICVSLKLQLIEFKCQTQLSECTSSIDSRR